MLPRKTSKRFKLTMILLSAVLFCGCIADNKTKQSRNDDSSIVVNQPPVISVDEPKKELDVGALKEDISSRVSSRIQNEMANNNSQLSGHITGQIHKLEVALGKLFEARFDTSLAISNKMNNHLEDLIKANVELSVQLKNQMSVNAEIKNDLEVKASLIEKLKLENAELETKVQAVGQAAANAQIGKNDFDQMVKTIDQRLEASAGRDVNTTYYPPEAVEAMRNEHYMFLGILSILSAIVMVVIRQAYKNAQVRMDNERKNEKEERAMLQERFNKVLALLSADKGKELFKGASDYE